MAFGDRFHKDIFVHVYQVFGHIHCLMSSPFAQLSTPTTSFHSQDSFASTSCPIERQTDRERKSFFFKLRCCDPHFYPNGPVSLHHFTCLCITHVCERCSEAHCSHGPVPESLFFFLKIEPNFSHAQSSTTKLRSILLAAAYLAFPIWLQVPWRQNLSFWLIAASTARREVNDTWWW